MIGKPPKMTPIKNKAQEILWWIDRVHEDDGEVGVTDIIVKIRKKWPDLLPEIHELILNTVLEEDRTKL